jgi:hypothetical protein
MLVCQHGDYCRQLWWRLRLPYLLHNRHCPHTDGGNTPYQLNHLFLVIAEAVAVELLADGGVFGFALFVLIQNSLH